MKTIISILALVAVTQAALLEVDPPKKTLLRPTIITRLTFTPNTITARWIPVKIAAEPTVGYKVKLRVFEGTVINRIDIVNGTEVDVEEIQKPNISDVTLDSPHKLYEYKIHGANHTELTINGVKIETPYMLHVLPFSEKGDGPTSSPLGFQINKDDTVRFVAQTNVVIVNRLGSKTEASKKQA